MGMCGCAEFSPTYVIPGPKGFYYAITVYNGCQDCANPVGVMIDRISTDQLEDYGITKKDIVREPNITIPMIDPSKLLEVLDGVFSGCKIEMDGESIKPSELLDGEEYDIAEEILKAAGEPSTCNMDD
jgi:hypothetical protein